MTPAVFGAPRKTIRASSDEAGQHLIQSRSPKYEPLLKEYT
jgi:hypothetical protein